jgi:excisionase family DNA binding protein
MSRPARVRLLAAPTPSDPTDEPLLPTKDAAARLGLAADTLKRMARRGEIPSVKYGKLRRFEPAVIRAYIARHRTQQAG